MPLLAGNSPPPPAALLSAAASLAAHIAPTPTDGATIDVSITGLRSQKGMVRACLTRNPAFFPNCDKDPDSLKESVSAKAPRLRFAGIANGDYALTVLHDENSNARADMLFGIPREGVGFSENPALHFGPPSFSASHFRVAGGEIAKQIAMKYFL